MNKEVLAFLRPELAQRIIAESEVQHISKGTEILKARQYVNVLPIVLEGLVKVYSAYEER